MDTPLKEEASREAEGVIQDVDSVNRDLRVLVLGRLTLFDVPVDCTILLHGEAVKLRLLQPRDQVRVTYTLQNGNRIAECIAIGVGQQHRGSVCDAQKS